MSRALFALGVFLGFAALSGCQSSSPDYKASPEGTAYYSREPVSQIDRAVSLQEGMGRISRSQLGWY